MKKNSSMGRLINFRTFIFGLFLALLVYFFLMVLSGWEELLHNIVQADPFIILVAMMLSLGNYIFRFLKWQLFTKSLNLEVSLVNNILIFFSGLSLAITPAKAGEAIRAFLLREMSSSGLSQGLASTFSERLIDLLAVTILAFIGIVLLGNNQTVIYLPILLLILLAIILGVVIFLFNPLYNIFVKIFMLEKWGTLGSKINQFRSDVIITFHFLTFIGALILGLIGWTCEGIGFFLIAQNLQIQITLDTAILIYATSSLLGAISFLPGGLGVMEGSMEVFLADLLKIAAPLAGALIILIRLTTLWFGVGLGLIFLLIVVKRLNPSSKTEM